MDLAQPFKRNHLIEDLFLEHYRPLTAFAFRFLNDIEESKDVVQGVFIKLYEKGDSIYIAQPEAYLFKAVHNECLNSLKRNRVRKLHQEEYTRTISDTDMQPVWEQTQREHKIFKAIEALPPQCKRIFVMSRMEDRKNSEIAQELSISIRTVETQISNALRQLRTAIQSFLFF